MIFKTLYSKIAVTLLVIFMLVGSSFVIMTLYTTSMYQQEVSQKLNRDLAGNIAAATKFFLPDNSINNQALAKLFHQLMVINPSIELYLLDQDGKILAYSANPDKVKRKRVSLGPIKAWLSGKTPELHLGDDPRNPNGQKVFSVARLPKEGNLTGYLYVILGGEEYDSAAKKIHNSYVLRLSGWAIAAGIMFALSAALLLFAQLTGRLSRLAKKVDTFRSKEQSTPEQDLIKSRHGDEIETLALAFGAMSNRIEQQIEEIRQSDSLRRELVANVSHDLRTPLSTLQGYIETIIIKDNNMAPDERRRYLKIAINHCKRLSHLIEDLFELARLDATENQLDVEPFNLAELLQDLLQEFQLEAEQKDITLKAAFEQKLPFVNADIGLIQRVFENLLKNALRHTPENGIIELILVPAGNEIAVQVKNSGSAIVPEALPHIFERFYQIEDMNGKAHGLAGLGLAITKKILALHGMSITVDSSSENGTTFSFKLPQ